jgi:hypothetical protein
MGFNLGDIVLFNGQLGQIDGIEIDNTNDNEIIGIEVLFLRKYSDFNGRLTFLRSKLNDLKLYRKRVGSFQYNEMDYMKHIDNETIFSK